MFTPVAFNITRILWRLESFLKIRVIYREINIRHFTQFCIQKPLLVVAIKRVVVADVVQGSTTKGIAGALWGSTTRGIAGALWGSTTKGAAAASLRGCKCGRSAAGTLPGSTI